LPYGAGPNATRGPSTASAAAFGSGWLSATSTTAARDSSEAEKYYPTLTGCGTDPCALPGRAQLQGRPGASVASESHGLPTPHTTQGGGIRGCSFETSAAAIAAFTSSNSAATVAPTVES
jgi:hypothetical protein